jgi:hypothetical protein
VRADAIRADDVVQAVDDLDRVIRYDVDLVSIGACRDFSRVAAKRDRRDDRLARLDGAMGLAGVFVLAYWAIAAVIAVEARHPSASAAVGVRIDGQLAHGFCLPGFGRYRRADHRLTTVTCLRDTITSSRAPLSRVTVKASG